MTEFFSTHTESLIISIIAGIVIWTILALIIYQKDITTAFRETFFFWLATLIFSFCGIILLLISFFGEALDWTDGLDIQPPESWLRVFIHNLLTFAGAALIFYLIR